MFAISSERWRSDTSIRRKKILAGIEVVEGVCVTGFIDSTGARTGWSASRKARRDG